MRKQSNRMTHKKKALLDALAKSLGVVTVACKKVGVERSTFYRYYREDPEFKKQVDDLNDVALDFAESKLIEAMGETNVTAIIFYLKTKGKHRGYTEQIEIKRPDPPRDLSKLTEEELELMAEIEEKLKSGDE